MKNFLPVIFFLGITLSLQAQERDFKAFKFDLAIGYAKPTGSSSTDSTTTISGGILIALEPKYAISNNLSVGLRFETSLSGSANISLDTASFSGTQSAKSVSSLILTGDYYLTSTTIRPFIGGGAGMFFTGGLSANFADSIPNSADAGAGTKFGIMPRVGFEAGHFRVAAEYNFVGKVNGTAYNYIGFKIGFFLGGGRLGDGSGDGGGGGRKRNRRSPSNRGTDPF
jgi:outer membrane protein X